MEDDNNGFDDDATAGVGETYTRDDYAKADDKGKGKGNDDPAKGPGPAPAPGPASGPTGGPGGPGGPGTDGFYPAPPPPGTPFTGGSTTGESKGPGGNKGPGGSGSPTGNSPSDGGAQAQSGECVLRGRKYRTCFKLDDGVMMYFTLKDNKLQFAFSAKSANWAAFVLGDPTTGAPALLAKTCGKECAAALGTTAKGGYALKNFKGKSEVKFSGIKAFLTADGTYQVLAQMAWPKGEKSIKVAGTTSLNTDMGAGAKLTKIVSVSKATLLA